MSLISWLINLKRRQIIAVNQDHRPTVKLDTVEDVAPLLQYPPPTPEQLASQAAVSLGKVRDE